METMKFKIEIEVDVTEEQMSDVMVTALEGGINYWCRKAEMKKDTVGGGFEGVSLENEENLIFASDIIGKGGILILHDAESDDTWELNQEKLLNGIKRYMIEENIGSMEELIDNHDADTADQIVQYAVFNEQMFA
jgi:hypothetical protein